MIPMFSYIGQESKARGVFYSPGLDMATQSEGVFFFLYLVLWIRFFSTCLDRFRPTRTGQSGF